MKGRLGAYLRIFQLLLRSPYFKEERQTMPLFFCFKKTRNDKKTGKS
ncbi:hypothetical protein HMPREF0083_04846 [Aneurinibacillus aneurinilyticus ATCC 12856]|uniref:Uncharacterized protein n=1 Tax=Aneurinibacillus aneurinilyticus ATCC 12856 TaxID=649747 RepID=U1Y881_ANEAE|nr:hypothetical protein HMPREF0083_04846 [Aneurinibacillus aneurinilyticus ATCC 12856]